MTVSEFARRWRARDITSSEVTEHCLKAIAADNPRLNAFILVMADEARQAAATADRERDAGHDRGPLHGVPIAVKDLFDIKGTATTAASRVREGHVAGADAAAITTLRDAGAILIGKTNLHEFAFGTTNEDSAFGPSLNPRDPSRISGGSSGGSAVSVATGMALAALGTDTGGSIRIPAAACGIVGLKPTYGELSTDGVVPLSRTLDHVGPMTATVTDAWHVYHALAGRQMTRPFSVPPAGQQRFAVPRRYFLDLLDDDVRRHFDAAVARLQEAGAVVSDVEFPLSDLIAPVYIHISFSDAAAYHADALDTMPEKYTAPVRLRLEMARYVLGEDYVRALAGREALTREVSRALSGYDALMLPTLPMVAPALGTTTVDLGGSAQPVRNMMLRLTQLFNITGHPAISLPNGFDGSGLPTGLQLVGTRGQTDALLHTARSVEAALER